MNEIKEIVDHYGEAVQIAVCQEEMNELGVELSKYVRGQGNREAIIEEMADVYITLAEQRYIHHINLNEVLLKMEEKLERMKERMNERDRQGD